MEKSELKNSKNPTIIASSVSSLCKTYNMN